MCDYGDCDEDGARSVRAGVEGKPEDVETVTLSFCIEHYNKALGMEEEEQTA